MSAVRPKALITGGAKRVGAAIARTLAHAGCDLVLTYRTSASAAEALAQELRTNGTAVDLFRLDLSDTSVLEKSLSDRLPATCFEQLDILVHNASAYRPTPLGSISADDALHQFRINALSPLLLTQSVAPALRASTLPGGGAIVALTDIHAQGLPRPDFAAYSMSKAALTEMVRTLAVALAPEVRVNAVSPGVVAWPDEGYESDAPAQQAYLSRVPLARAGTPEDAAAAVRYLALDAHYTTGQILRVDGGRWLR